MRELYFIAFSTPTTNERLTDFGLSDLSLAVTTLLFEPESRRHPLGSLSRRGVIGADLGGRSIAGSKLPDCSGIFQSINHFRSSTWLAPNEGSDSAQDRSVKRCRGAIGWQIDKFLTVRRAWLYFVPKLTIDFIVYYLNRLQSRWLFCSLFNIISVLT